MRWPPPASTPDDARTTCAYNCCSQEIQQRRTPSGRTGSGVPDDHHRLQVRRRRRRDETASERERTRARQLNDAYDQLRRVVPRSAHDERRRLSKIATLRLAINYLGALMTLISHRQMSSLSAHRPDNTGTV